MVILYISGIYVLSLGSLKEGRTVVAVCLAHPYGCCGKGKKHEALFVVVGAALNQPRAARGSSQSSPRTYPATGKCASNIFVAKLTLECKHVRMFVL